MLVFLLLHAQLACTVGAMKEAQEGLEAFFSLEKGATHFNAHALALILRLPELGLAPLGERAIPPDAPAIFELSLLKNHLEGRNSLAYLIGQSDSASLTFFLAQIEERVVSNKAKPASSKKHCCGQAIKPLNTLERSGN